MSSKERLQSALKTFGAAYMLMERRVATGLDLSYPQLKTLEYLAAHPDGATVNRLADAQGVALSTMTRNIQVMERLGWVSKSRGVSDKRTIEVSLTGQGQEQANVVLDKLRRYLDESVQNIHSSDWIVRAAAVENLTAGIKRVLKNDSATVD